MAKYHEEGVTCTNLNCDDCGREVVKCRINFDEIDNLVGRILTIIDATISDPEQRTAQKRIIRKEIHAWYYDIEREQHPEFRKMMEYGKVTIE